MKHLEAFFRQKVPRAGKDLPGYYRSALVAGVSLLMAYFPLCFLLFGLRGDGWHWMPLLMLAAAAACRQAIGRVNARACVYMYAATNAIWSAWCVHAFGWSTGAQHLLLPLMVLIFFNIYEPPWLKAAWFAAQVGLRMALFRYSTVHVPTCALSNADSMFYQSLNSITISLILATICAHLSTDLQEAERQLRIDNQELHREAGTDPLTQLPNRRAMLDAIDAFQVGFPEEHFCIAIADIDFFKRVNDTYGHNCGDYTLRALADRFREAAGEAYSVCRWGGEEFCFFLPGMNLDAGGQEMQALCEAVARMPLSFGGHDFTINITIGVEENDFQSPVDAIIESADRKLYMGKNGGRNQVVI